MNIKFKQKGNGKDSKDSKTQDRPFRKLGTKQIRSQFQREKGDTFQKKNIEKTLFS